MSTAPSVSVIIPTYRDRGYITETLASVLRNIGPDDEVLVIANGSEAAYVEKLRGMATAPIRLIDISTPCVSTARNTGASEARGDLLQFLDDDDVLHDGGLAALRSALGEHPEWLAAVGNVEFFGDAQPSTWHRHPTGHGSYSALSIMRATIATPGAGMVRRSAITKIGGFNRDHAPTEDFDLWMRLALAGQIFWLDVPAIRYRVHGDAVSRQAARMAGSSLRVFRKHMPAVQKTIGARDVFGALRKRYRWYGPRLRQSLVDSVQQRNFSECVKVARTILLYQEQFVRLGLKAIHQRLFRL